MKKGFIGGMVIMTFLLFLTSCDCDCNFVEKGVHRFKLNQIVYHKLGENKLLIVDTIRKDCELFYEVRDMNMEYHYVSEQELK
jgi:hypothetical protein